MKGLSANLSMLFTELPFLQRFDAAATAGFTAAEFWFPYDHQPEEVRYALRSANLQCVVINSPAGNVTAGEWGLSVLPESSATFKLSLAAAIDYAQILGSENLHVMAGIVPAVQDDTLQAKTLAVCQITYLENLAFAAEQTRRIPLKLLIEPLNSVDRPRYFLSTLEQAIQIVESVGGHKIAVMWDIYHTQMQQGNLAAKIRTHAQHFGHVQLADVPGRHEPGTGEINWRFLMKQLQESGYQGWIGLEYKPTVSSPKNFDMNNLLFK
jgi:hydroxypyruvate isomerase